MIHSSQVPVCSISFRLPLFMQQWSILLATGLNAGVVWDLLYNGRDWFDPLDPGNPMHSHVVGWHLHAPPEKDHVTVSVLFRDVGPLSVLISAGQTCDPSRCISAGRCRSAPNDDLVVFLS